MDIFAVRAEHSLIREASCADHSWRWIGSIGSYWGCFWEDCFVKYRRTYDPLNSLNFLKDRLWERSHVLLLKPLWKEVTFRHESNKWVLFHVRDFVKIDVKYLSSIEMFIESQVEANHISLLWIIRFPFLVTTWSTSSKWASSIRVDSNTISPCTGFCFYWANILTFLQFKALVSTLVIGIASSLKGGAIFIEYWDAVNEFTLIDSNLLDLR